MSVFADLFPIILFFVAYKFFGIYVATGVAIAVAVVQASYTWITKRKLDKLLIMSTLIIVVLGGATLMLHNEVFIKWKPTAINWIFALVFLGSHFIGQKPIIERLMEHSIELPKPIWLRLNLSWVIFFTVMGLLNIYVIYNYDTNAWVNFKLFGMLGLTFIFAIVQAWYISMHGQETTSK